MMKTYPLKKHKRIFPSVASDLREYPLSDLLQTYLCSIKFADCELTEVVSRTI